MNVETASLFFALLAIAANIGLAAVALATVIGPSLRARLGITGLWAEVRHNALWIAFVVAAVATFGSLWFSEVENLVPCRLCWFQRIAMYPNTVLLGVAALTRDRNVRRYVLPIVVIGTGISTWHYLVEWFPTLEGDACDLTAPCSFVWFRRFGFASLPYMALSAFLFVAVLTLIADPKEADAMDRVPR